MWENNDMNNLLVDSLNKRSNLLFYYGNIIPSINKLICSARHKYVIQTGTCYDLESTIISDISYNIAETYYNNLFYANTISHNFSILKINNFYIGIGGVSQPSYLVGNNLASHCKWGNYWEGLYLMKSNDCNLWTNPIKIIDRDWGLRNNCCCFDSQPSLTYDSNTGIYYLYCRNNPDLQVRKLQVFRTNNIDNWSNNAVEINIDIDIYIYTAHIFKYKDKFVAVVRYYFDTAKYTYDNHQIGILISNDGINFTVFKECFIDNYIYEIHGDITQGHNIINNELKIYFLCINGKINEYNINI